MAANLMLSHIPPSRTTSLTLSNTHFFTGKTPLTRIGAFSPLSPTGRNIAFTYKKPHTTTVMMAKRELELKEIREKSTEDINEEVIDLKGELQMLRFKKNTRQQELKTSEFRRMRKRVARLLTVRRERELEQGIKKRQSRKLDRAWKRSIVVRPPPSLRKLLEDRAAKTENKDS